MAVDEGVFVGGVLVKECMGGRGVVMYRGWGYPSYRVRNVYLGSVVYLDRCRSRRGLERKRQEGLGRQAGTWEQQHAALFCKRFGIWEVGSI